MQCTDAERQWGDALRWAGDAVDICAEEALIFYRVALFPSALFLHQIHSSPSTVILTLPLPYLLSQVCQLQRLLFKHWPPLKELALSNCGSVEKRELLKRSLGALPAAELRHMVVSVFIFANAGSSYAFGHR